MMTITEALSEINLITKKIEKKKPEVIGSLVFFEGQTDPYMSEGGTKAFYHKTMRSIKDLQDRLMKIRKAIHQKNIETTLSVDGVTKTMDEWLTWKKDIYPVYSSLLQIMETGLSTEVEKNKKSPRVFKTNPQDVNEEFKLTKLIPSVDLGELQKEREQIISIYEKLDGQLSLKNATTTIDI